MERSKLARQWFQDFTGYDTRCDLPAAELATLAVAGTLGPPKNAIDLGCGHATDAIFLARLGWNVRAVDSDDDDEGPLLAARRRVRELPTRVARRITIQRANILSSRFRVPDREQFTLVLSRLVINNLLLTETRPDTARRMKLIAVAARLASDGGVFVLRTTAGDFEEPRLLRAIEAHFEPVVQGGEMSIEYPALTTQHLPGESRLVTAGIVPTRMYLLRRRPR